MWWFGYSKHKRPNQRPGGASGNCGARSASGYRSTGCA
jgi:hypothetical protein